MVIYSDDIIQRIDEVFLCRLTFSFIDDDKSGFILEIIDGRELPEYMTMNKGKICG